MNIKISRDTEFLAVSLRPYYLPMEFSHALVFIVYIRLRPSAEAACDVIYSAVPKIQTQHPEALVLMTKHWLLSTSMWTVKPGGKGRQI